VTRLEKYSTPKLRPHILSFARNLANSRCAKPIWPRSPIAHLLLPANGRDAGKVLSDLLSRKMQRTQSSFSRSPSNIQLTTIFPLSCAYSLTCLPLLVVIYRRPYKSNASWPFYLITKCRAVRPLSAQYRKLKPRSDFIVLKSGLPRLLVEVNSTTVRDWPPDHVRVLLQGAAIVRFANTFLDEFKEKRDFVLIAIFIRDAGTATRHALYQRGNPQDSQAVCYAIHKQACRLSDRRFITTQRSLTLKPQLAVLNSPVNCITSFTS